MGMVHSNMIANCWQWLLDIPPDSSNPTLRATAISDIISVAAEQVAAQHVTRANDVQATFMRLMCLTTLDLQDLALRHK